MPNFKFFFNTQANTLDIVLHGGNYSMDSGFMMKIVDKCRANGHSVAAFNFPYLDRGEDHSSGPELLEEIAALKDVLTFCQAENYQNIRLIGKSLGGIAASFYLKKLSPDELKKYSVVILGYVLGDIDLKTFPGKITIIQGEEDRFGDIAAVKKDMETAVSKDVTFFEIPGADHSYRNDNKEPEFEDKAIASI